MNAEWSVRRRVSVSSHRSCVRGIGWKLWTNWHKLAAILYVPVRQWSSLFSWLFVWFTHRRRLRSASSLTWLFVWLNYRHMMLVRFIFAGPRLWISLPPHVPSVSSINIFKTCLKAFFSSRSFPLLFSLLAKNMCGAFDISYTVLFHYYYYYYYYIDGHRFSAPDLPWWSLIQELTTTSKPLLQRTCNWAGLGRHSKLRYFIVNHSKQK